MKIEVRDSNNEWVSAQPTKQQMTDILAITLANGSVTRMGVNHLQPILIGGTLANKEASLLQVGDRLPTRDSAYSEIVDIVNEGPREGTDLYCFEVANDDHLFTLNNGLITHNCRLQLDLRELLKRGNGLFGSAEQTGSIGVVTVNMARLGYTHKGDETALLARLDELMNLAKESLEKKREVVQYYINQGLFPYTQRYLGSLRNHFSTIGINGVNEMIRNFTYDAHDITDEWGHEFAVRVLDHIRARMVEFQEETGHMYNLEATPAEGTTYRFAKEDRRLYPDIIQAGTDAEPYYTNSSQLPVGYTEDPFQALSEQVDLQRKYTGGTVLHLYMPERVSDAEACKQLVKRSLSNFALPYITITPTFSICPNHGYIAGEHKVCPTCSETNEVWCRVMGYFRPVSSFNIGKRGEYAERVSFKEKAAQESTFA